MQYFYVIMQAHVSYICLVAYHLNVCITVLDGYPDRPGALESHARVCFYDAAVICKCD